MDLQNIKYHKLLNKIQMIVLFAAMAGLLGITGWVIGGLAGAKFALILACISWLFNATLPARLVMKFFRARPLNPRMAQGLYQLSHVLAQRAGLKKTPVLYLIPGTSMTAFATGSKDDPAICLGQRLLQTLNTNEIAGILGHEITHIKNNDIRVMGYAGIFNRITYYTALIGQFGLIFYLPFALMKGIDISLLPVMLIAFAPALSLLLNLALSRSREYEADLGSALLTGSPDYLTSALRKLEAYQKNMQRWFGIPMTMDSQTSMLSTHPPTRERIRRLQSFKSGQSFHLSAG